MNYTYSDNPIIWDHIYYYSIFKKAKKDYPYWQIAKNIDEIFLCIFKALNELSSL
tara:strand:- start:799 stop:963 length:165 start_codon:yes stop_codon:yes gene_type:complete